MATRRVSWIIAANVDRWSKNLRSAQRSMDKFVRQTERAGRTLFRNVTLPITAAAGASIKMASDFESSMSKIEGLVGVAREEVQAMRGDVLRLAGDTARAPQELADALFFVTSAGLRGADAIKVLEASARASAAGLGETKTVADLVTSAVNAYGLENLSAAKATDILVASVREGKAEADELAQSMGQVLPIASNLGVSFDQVGAAIAAMTRTGTNAQTAGMQLRQILASLLKPTTQAERALKDMGTSSEGLRKQLREKGLVSVLGFLREQMEDNEQAMSQVFPNIRALSGALDIMGANAEDNVGIFRRMTDTTGSLDKAFDAAANTTQFKFQQSLAELKTVAIDFGNTMLPVANKVLESVTRMIRNFTNLSNESRIHIIKVAGLFAAAGPLLIAIAKAAKIIAGFASLVLSKFVLVGAAIAIGVTAIQWLRDNWETILSKLGKRVSDWAEKAGGAFSSVWQRFLKLRSEMGAVLAEGVEHMKANREEAKKAESQFTSFGDSFKKVVETIVSSAMSLTGADKAWEQFSSLFNDVSNNSKESAENVDKATIAYRRLATTIDSVTPPIIAKVEGAKFAFGGMKDSAIEMGQALQTTVSSSVTSFAETLGNAFTGDAGANGFFRNILLVVADFGKQLGRMLVAAGVAALSFQKLLMNPVAAIAAGGALIVASTAVSNLLKKGPARQVNDALIRSDGSIVEFHPDDNILAMKDFSNIGVTGGQAIHNQLFLDGALVWQNQKEVGRKIGR